MHNILSLEGNGDNTLITAEVLKLIEQKSGKQLFYSFDHVGAASTASFLGALIASGKSAEESSLIVKKSFKKVFEVPDYFCAKWKDEWNYNPIKWVAWGKCMFWDSDKSYSQKALDELLLDMPSHQQIGDLKMHLTLTAAATASKIAPHHYLSKSTPEIQLKDAVRNSIFDKRYFDSPEDSKSNVSTSNGVAKLPVVAQLANIISDEKIHFNSIFLVAVIFDSPNLESYREISPSISEKHKKEIANASRDDVVEALKAIFHGESKDHFRVIKITEEGGLKPDVFSFNRMLSNERFDQVLKSSQICDYKGCQPLCQGIDKLVSDIEIYHNDNHDLKNNEDTWSE